VTEISSFLVIKGEELENNEIRRINGSIERVTGKM
jgi:hypothetical protein